MNILISLENGMKFVSAKRVSAYGMATILSMTILLIATSAHAEQRCELWSELKASGEADARYHILKGDHSFVDMKTCLIWNLDLPDEEHDLSDAFGVCARKGSRLTNGVGGMGWRLPSAAELTSLDVFYDDPSLPMRETIIAEGPIWTSSPWPPAMQQWAAVTFTQRGTTVVVPADPKTEQARAWCVR